jgi:SAM-dependent methyltransferase
MLPDKTGGNGAGTSGAPARKAMDFAAERDWPGYYRAVLGKSARETLVYALDTFDKESAATGSKNPFTDARGLLFAVDLGCGEGRDTLELLRRGWRVLAIDDHPEAFEHLVARVPPAQADQLETRIAGFRNTRLPRADLVNASYALPFCEPGDFPAVWREIAGAIRRGGRFAGQFFGDRDDWARLPDRTHHTRSQVEELLREFEVEMFKEEEKDDATATGGWKHWQIFHVVARRK